MCRQYTKALKKKILILVIENGFHETQAHENTAFFQKCSSFKRNWHLRNYDASGRPMQCLKGIENNQTKLSTGIHA